MDRGRPSLLSSKSGCSEGNRLVSGPAPGRGGHWSHVPPPALSAAFSSTWAWSCCGAEQGDSTPS